MKNNYLTNSEKIFIFFVLLFVLSIVFHCCTPQQRLNRLVKLHPDLLSTNTIYIKDTIIKKDTFVLMEKKDSFIIKTDTIIRTKKFIIEKRNDILKIVTRPDTIFFTDTIYYEKKISAPVIKTDAEIKVGLKESIIISLVLIITAGLFWQWIKR